MKTSGTQSPPDAPPIAMPDPDPDSEPSPHDHVLRAITDDDDFRVITAITSDTVRRALVSQRVTGTTAHHFADLLTGTVLIRETMSPGHRVQGLLKGPNGRGSLVADSHPDGVTRGLVQLPIGMEEFSIGDGSMLQMMRSMAHGRVHRSVVQAPSGQPVSTALMTYMQESEQIVSVIATGSHWQNDTLVHAGGYVVQLLPGASRGPLMIMTERLEAMPPIERILANLNGSALRLLDELLHRMPYAQLDDRPVSFGCKCSQQAVVASLASINRDELAEMVNEQEVIELTCDYCNTDYRVASAQLMGLLATS
jgi:molecular chaperone Hsp33